MFQECGHAGICYDCAVTKVLKQSQKCFICRKEVNVVLRLDPSSLNSDFLLVKSATYVNKKDLDKIIKTEENFPNFHTMHKEM